MSDTVKTITIEDVHNLVDAKSRDPQIAPKDLYRQIDRVKADNSIEMWKVLWIPLVIAVFSILGMLFFTENVEIRVWHRLSIISFVIANIWGICLLRKYDKQWWWILLFDVIVMYLIFADALSFKELIQLITTLL